MLYDLRRARRSLKWLVTLLLATFGASYLFGAWMVAPYAGFTPTQVAATFAESEMAMHMPPDTTMVVERPMSLRAFGESDVHPVDLDLLIQDTHVHLPMYGVIAAMLGVVALGLSLPKGWHLVVISLLFAAPWLDFAGMWLTKLVSSHFAFATVVGGWLLAVGYLFVTGVALWQMWFSKKGVSP